MSELNVTLIENEADSTAVQLNRKATDGDIIDLQKDGSTVGSIASDSNGRVIYNSENNAGYIGVNGVRRYYWTGTDLSPMTDGGPDLGASSFRFKDLYLSGGVYVGGTGSANYLDDYEEGTWTPAPYAGSWSGDNVSGHYVKVGRMVSIIVDIRNVSIDATASTSNVIKNLPFTNGGKRSACSQITYYNTFDNVNVAGIIESNNTQIIFVQIQASGAWLTSTFRNASNSYIQLFATYYTDY